MLDLLTWWRLSNRFAPGNAENAATRKMTINEKLIILQNKSLNISIKSTLNMLLLRWAFISISRRFKVSSLIENLKLKSLWTDSLTFSKHIRNIHVLQDLQVHGSTRSKISLLAQAIHTMVQTIWCIYYGAYLDHMIHMIWPIWYGFNDIKL